MDRKDLRKLLRELEAQGYEYRVARSGHYIVTKDGQRVTTISGTPSDYRSDRNAKADLRRSGFDWPRK